VKISRLVAQTLVNLRRVFRLNVEQDSIATVSAPLLAAKVAC
jgi:hypothetical protein